jgi:epoxyqueuosine reductase
MDSQKIKQLILQKSNELGFFYCGFSKAEFLEEEAPRLEKWLNLNHHGKMGYMANHFDKRLDPRLLVDNAKTVVSLLLNYFPEERQNGESPKISKYAYGEDYHNVIKDKLKDLLTCLKEEVGDISGRAFVDSAPVMDKVWAKKAGLGWIGKNSNLIHPKEGSFFFIAELIIDLEIEPDGPMKDYCGTCTRCIDACPTNAIVQPYVVDGSKCISYLTIELKDELLPKEFSGKMDNWMFGCDVCQDVCPWNRFSKITHESRFKPNPMLLELKSNDWQELNEEVFNQLFKLSAVKRTKITGLTRNIKFLT